MVNKLIELSEIPLSKSDSRISLVFVFKALQMSDLDKISVSSFEKLATNEPRCHHRTPELAENKFINFHHSKTKENEKMSDDANRLFDNKHMDTSWRVCYGITTIILSFLLFLWFYFEMFACSSFE